MTPKQAAKIIKAGKPVKVECRGEVFSALFIMYDRHRIYSLAGGVFDRSEVQLSVKP